MTQEDSWAWDADTALSQVAEQIAAARERAVLASRVRDELDRVQGRCRSRRGEVEAVCDVTGRIMDLRFSRAAFDLSPADLSRVTVDVIGRARRQAARTAVGVVCNGFGAGDPTVAVIAEELGCPVENEVDW